MARNFKDWLRAYVEHASFTEAPKRMHFWAGVSAIAGALRRRVWIDQSYFHWHANHYIVFVAPPGIVSKTTTMGISMGLLRKVPGINFGPDVVTWPALVTAFASCAESFEWNSEYHTQCALTLESGEFGNLVNPADRDMIDLMVTLWDARTGAFKKVTKGNGNDSVENPWINMIACTTPAWIAGNFPDYVIGGGFTSRCLFVFVDKKEKLNAYPHKSVPADFKQRAELLTQDLEHIATNLVGPYQLTPAALEWGEKWYELHYRNPPVALRHDDRFGGYLARKQTHIHKLAMVIAAASRDELVIDAGDLQDANTMVSDLEPDMAKVFAKIGRSDESVHAERLIEFLKQTGEIPYEVAYKYVHLHFPKLRDFEQVLAGAINAGLIERKTTPTGFVLKAR